MSLVFNYCVIIELLCIFCKYYEKNIYLYRTDSNTERLLVINLITVYIHILFFFIFKTVKYVKYSLIYDN